ncbi:grpE protein homolog, mitochondrial [Lucilia cuprina]|uniref:grpE protein homolog, mitochondrial n=1 Tax=Lucilia cuprina TaxID=7375 RepID=UPI001F05AF9E|nr:grpE protein homolog, mitochondrial [Lucilia cuprina]
MATKQLINKQNTKLVSLLVANKPWKSCWSSTARCYSNEKSAEKETAQTEQASAANGEDAKKLAENIETLNKEVQELKEKNEELMDKYRRSLADSENLRVRLNKQIADAKIFGIQSFCKDLLEVADILGHATKAVPQDQLTDSNPHLKNLYEGLTMTNASLLQVFKRHGLEPMNPLNEKFNPNMHEALFQKPDSSVEPDTVIEVTKLGYKLHERVIRPALVGVSKS